MNWATRPGCHVDRLACAWLIRRFIDPAAQFVFVEDADGAPTDAILFDMRGVQLSHHGGSCTFETFLSVYGLSDEALIDISRIVHEADLADELFDAPEAPGLDALLTGLGLSHSDEEMLDLGYKLFDGLYALRRRANDTTSRLLERS